MQLRGPTFLIAALCLALSPLACTAQPIAFGNTMKIGEVTPTSAIVWTRLTARPALNREGIPWPKWSMKKCIAKPLPIPAGKTLADMAGAMPGATGQVQLTLKERNDPTQKNVYQSELVSVDPKRDFTMQFAVTGLKPATAYRVILVGRTSRPGMSSCDKAICIGSFTTAPKADVVKPITFVAVTGQRYDTIDTPWGPLSYKSMAALKPDFFVHAGDILYYDKLYPWVKGAASARFKWNRMYGLEYIRAMHSVAVCYMEKDDHETLQNDCDPWSKSKMGTLTFKRGLEIFREQVPMGDKTYRTFRWGKDLQIWLLEGRDFRSKNRAPDGPDKTILGKAQKAWLAKTLAESDATFKIVISPTPIVGPDRATGKNDNHANKGFTHEGDWLRGLIGKAAGCYIICGDRHWQYASVDKQSGAQEFCTGPISDKHAGGFSQKHKSDMHRYLLVRGGFLKVEVCRDANNKPTISFVHCAPDGKERNRITKARE